MKEIEREGFNLNISRYVSTAQTEPEIDLQTNFDKLEALDREIVAATQKHNAFLIELGLKPLKYGGKVP